ncbi:dicarboxylate/amino acid:cation symporter [Planococcus maritimus]|uniref:dicarboxylate/amino acid:cation symporter n=1 Tax=Planococcus maritimus TaxID=192421 RepID=UPI000795FCD0|nr:dicarboxylate/amino acid:cation symporter [Planococcus maritimus]KYG60114.1 sodium:dicarboxylate symporter [Planococcus maritimus]OED33801.1 sodium:dicarboxylate symporter [Planococcus maritimus]
MKALWKSYANVSLILKITVALILGVIVGLIFGPDTAVLAPLGDLLLRLLTFLIVPLIFFTLIVGINQSKIGDLGRMGGKVFLFYVLSSAFAIVVGLTVASIFQPGSGMQLDGSETFDVPDNPGFTSVLLNIVPSNIISAFSDMNLLGIIFTAFAFGIAISYMRSSEEFGELGKHLMKTITALNEATLIILKVILQYVPIGIFAIMAKTVGAQGLDTLGSLLGMVAVLYIAIAVQIALYIVAMLVFKVSPLAFFKQARTPMLTAFVTQSSSGTLPLTLDAARGLDISKSLYGFSLPLGATINMDGAAIRIAVSAIFAANIIGDPLSLSEMFLVVLIGTLATIGTAGIPGAGIVMIATVFVQLGLPMEAVALLTAIDALVGMGATMLNVTGDLAGSKLIDQSEKRRGAAKA